MSIESLVLRYSPGDFKSPGELASYRVGFKTFKVFKNLEGFVSQQQITKRL